MQKPKTAYASPAHAEVDDLAVELRSLRDALAEIQEEAALDLAIIKELYAGRLVDLKARAAALTRKIQALEKKHKGRFFAGPGTQANLPNIVLTYDVDAQVKKAAGILEALEELALLEIYGAPGYEGFAEAILVEKSVRYEVLDKWTDARLVMVGTERISKDVFSFELVEPKP